MKKIKYIWPIAWNLIVVFVAISIVDSLYYDDGALISASLGLIILGSIQTGLAIQVRTMATIAADHQKSFADIFRKLGDEESAEILEQDSKIITDKLRESNYKVITNSVGSTVIWIIAVSSILGSL